MVPLTCWEKRGDNLLFVFHLNFVDFLVILKSSTATYRCIRLGFLLPLTCALELHILLFICRRIHALLKRDFCSFLMMLHVTRRPCIRKKRKSYFLHCSFKDHLLHALVFHKSVSDLSSSVSTFTLRFSLMLHIQV